MKIQNFHNHPRINMVLLADIKPNPRNPRTENHKQTLLLASGIERWGFLVPIIVDETGMIVAGHARYRAATHLRLDYVPVVQALFVSEADRRAFALAENRMSELGGWNPDLLLEELNFLFEANYDLDITGFTLTDLDFSIGDAIEPDTPEEIELPDPMATAVSRSGDLWSIGAQRLLCGNSLEAASYDRLLGSKRAGMVFADGYHPHQQRRPRIPPSRMSAGPILVEEGSGISREYYDPKAEDPWSGL